MNTKLLSAVLFLLSLSSNAQNGCGGTFYDDGGPIANYSNNANFTTTICPNNPGDQVHVNFTAFSVEENFDGLYIYDGNSISSPQISSSNPSGFVPGGIPGAYWGISIPGPFISSSPDGCLTFQFISGGANSSTGWVADIYCAPFGECGLPPTSLIVPELTATSAVISWTSTSMATQWEVFATPCGLPAPTANSVGIITTVIPFIFTGLEPGTCYDFYVRNACAPVWDVSPWTGPISATTQNGVAIALVAFMDQNGNGTKEDNEPVTNYGDFIIDENNSGANQIVSVPSGGYSFEVLDVENTYDFSYVINSDFTSYFSCSTIFNDVSVAAASGLNTFYFPVQIVTPYNDVSVNIIPLSNPQPGFQFTNRIMYRNLGLFAASGTINFTKDTAISIASISQTGTSSNSNGFSYNFSDLQPNETRFIDVQFQVPTIPTVTLGQLVSNSVEITPTTEDINPLNNSASLTQTIIGSYDPNDISESHGHEIVHSQFSSNDYLYYTIRFQNSGTANATTVRIEDLLDDQLDFATIQMINASHLYSMTRTNNQVLWQFDDIQLVPESVNNEASQGYVLFKIKPLAGYSIGDIIPNSAAIYFDFNPPIITNTFETEFVAALSTEQFSSNAFVLYPNPASHYVSLKLSSNSEYNSVSVTDMLGKSMKVNADFLSDVITIDTSSLSKGLYIISVNFSDGTKSTQKLIIE